MNQNSKNQFLMANNENKIKTYIMTELSKKHNIQPVLKSIDTKITQIIKTMALFMMLKKIYYKSIMKLGRSIKIH